MQGLPQPWPMGRTELLIVALIGTFLLLMLLLVVAAVYLLACASRRRGRMRGLDPLEELTVRLAAGEMTVEEYDLRRQGLE